MKYTILINQAAVVEAGLHKTTDLVDWAILEYINGWQTNPEATRINDFVWINYKHFIAEMPLVGLNTKSGVSNRLKKLEELLLIEKIHDEDSRAFCKTTALFHQITQFKIRKLAGKSGRGGVHENERGVHENERGVHENERGVHENERGVHENEQSTNNQNKQSKQIIKNNNKPDTQNSALITVVLSGLTERQKEEARGRLAKLSPEQQDIAIQSFNKKMVSGEMKSPMAYLNVLVEKGLKNGLEAAGMPKSISTLTPAPKISEIDHKTRETLRLECIKAFVSNKKADLLKEFAEHGFVTSRGMGMIIEPDLKAAGLFD